MNRPRAVYGLGCAFVRPTRTTSHGGDKDDDHNHDHDDEHDRLRTKLRLSDSSSSPSGKAYLRPPATVANNFWGKEDAGVSPLLERMHNAKVTSDELKAFYTARAAIEEEYARKLLNLARKPLGSGETGTLRMSLDVTRGEVESMGKEHQAVASKMKTELDEPLAAFAGALKERRKIVQGGIEKLLKTKTAQAMAVNKSRDKFEQDCLKVKGYLAQGHMVMGQEERKNKAKLEKTQIQMSANSTEYENAVKILEETTVKWNREWKAACDKFQDLEEERLDFCKSSLWTFANISSTVCVSDDASCEKIRLSLEDCDVEKDIMSFIKESGTGQDIPDPPKYINFCRGDIDDIVSNHGDDDANYSVAQFARPMKPGLRSSSPQPSMFESHNDPDSTLREDMGIPRGVVQSEEAFNGRSSHGSAQVPPLAPTQTSSYGDIPQVPHNPYPTDGMTQFCRIGAPSERTSNPPPNRPDSRNSHDGHSDYSAPTSFKGRNPSNGYASPTKQLNESNVSSNYNTSNVSSNFNSSNVSSNYNYNGSAVSAVSSIGEDPTLNKKKSGFFQSHSPFRRKSQKSKDGPPASISQPTQRNTWTPANANASQPKPYGAGNRASTWGKTGTHADADVDAVDPRADYQLGIGKNVFDVASPDAQRKQPRKEAAQELDPIAQALAELKGVTKQASVRQSADLHYGMQTPAPGYDSRGAPAGAVPTPYANSGNRATPPPAYEQPVSRLGAPQPAHTSREMQKTTERFVNQKREMFNSGGAPPRPTSGMGRPVSPAPPRSASPRPYHNEPRQQQPPRAVSPNPYAAQQRPRAQSSSPIKQQQPTYAAYQSRGGSPGYQGPRAVSPNPTYNRPPSRAQEQGMALQLAPAGPLDAYGSQRGGRPRSQYYSDNGVGSQVGSTRHRSQSVGAQKQFTRDGRPIIQYARAMYMYQAAIAEELSFAKGDVLAVLRHQDDGWWEAEVVGKNERPGLVPSNYLKAC
ncbi:septation protein imp2 [Acrodontium crateriforme]|uniref:Septation protein imp2 n=1 Tax=Acrodontium crateriforme TaxID=150365 RepID=A0AAQ3R8D0_9PEZI|nr:septation protein imp2 [Acrodontium crateriforme]